MNILDAIGSTSMVKLERVVPPGCGEIFVKLEWENPTGSMKDRMALGAITRAEKEGRLKPGDTVVEYSGGSTGASLALVCAAKGYRLRIVSSDAFSQEKRDHMAALGAEMTLVRSEGGLATEQLFWDMIEVAKDWARAPGTFWFNQLENGDSIPGYHGLGREILLQMNGNIDAFVHCIGASASLQGVSQVLREHDPDVRIFAVEPAESAVMAGSDKGGHTIEGIGIGREPPLWRDFAVDGFLAVPSREAEAMARRLAREEGLMAGTSSGANVLAAIRISRRLGPRSRVATLLVDSGLKYLSTHVYRS